MSAFGSNYDKNDMAESVERLGKSEIEQGKSLCEIYESLNEAFSYGISQVLFEYERKLGETK